ncbi:hypothetical protein Tco_0651542 [Tanacetum coccineum]|uniref:Uncharacterized protein n=1 Tax=Tanacetum coccineum TaxID=301880 RepID=A0ABQ4WV31_9ASTR
MKSRKRRYIQHTSEDDTDKENDELRLCLKIAQDEEKEVDYEILDRKYPIIDWKTECLGTKPQPDEAKTIERDQFWKCGKELANPQATAWGKDFLKSLEVYNLPKIVSLLKTIWFINAPCYYNEALASPNSNDEELSIPEQTATGKGTSNPLMADVAEIAEKSKLLLKRDREYKIKKR